VTRAAIVTGGGTGIGRATALALHRDGFSVVIAGRRPEPLKAVREQIGDDCVIHPGDIRKPEVADALIGTALERFGRIDALVNNAGGQFVAPAEDITPNGWEAVRRLNLDAPWYLTQRPHQHPQRRVGQAQHRAHLRRAGVDRHRGHPPVRGRSG
jgi:citronellol/citronellal dehydrogenase